jgi:multicomponent Na+:H+ antiporter subunit E
MLALFFILWIVLNGRVTLELILLGIPIAAAVFLFAHFAFGYSVRNEVRIIRYTPLALWYLVTLVVEIFKASLHVMGIIINPATRPDPVLIEFDSGLPSTFQNVVLANSITLTPGTVTVEMKGDHFLVHCLIPEYAEGISESSFVKLLRRMNQ